MDVLTRLTLAHAARLARRGAYAAAEAVLAEAPATTAALRADVLDLRARIRVQQGLRPEAEALWREALLVEPAHENARAALALLGRSPRAPWHLGRAGLRAAAAAVVILLAWTALAQHRELERLRVPAEAPPPPTTGVPDAPPDEAGAFTAPLRAALEPLPGFSLLERNGALEVRFDEGLFREGTGWRPGAGDLVLRLARTLAALGFAGSVEVHGHTDPVPVRAGSVYGGNLSLGMARASRVADLLLDAGGLASSQVSVHTHGAESPPFPDDTPQGRRRNRTVTLHLRPGP